MGSVPFGGRYRLIDFPLSNMVNSGISKVGVITKSNYRSLMDHLGTGKPWDLSRKREGMFILPPFNSAEDSGGLFANRIDALVGCASFISSSTNEYVLLCDCNTICNIDINLLFDAHEQSGADITVAYCHGTVPALNNTMTFDLDSDGRIKEIAISSVGGEEGNYSLNVFLLKKSLLERLISQAASMHYTDFERDLIQANVGVLKICGYKTEGFVVTLDSLKSFYDANMALLDLNNRSELFCRKRPVYTKVRDEVPAIYGLGAAVKNSLVADGCKIEGTVENSILFRGVTIGKDAVVKNSIIMQGAYIGSGATLNSVIMDKISIIKPDKSLCGTNTFPVYVGKGIVV